MSSFATLFPPQNLIFRNLLVMMDYFSVLLPRSMIVKKGSQVFGGKLFLSFVVLHKIGAESLFTSAADTSG